MFCLSVNVSSNVSEGMTLESTLTGLGAAPVALVVMDAGMPLKTM